MVAKIFSFKDIDTTDPDYSRLISLDKYSSLKKLVHFRTVLPMELLLLELRYNEKPLQFYNSTPCMRPYLCRNLNNKKKNLFQSKGIPLGKINYQVASYNNSLLNIIDRLGKQLANPKCN